MAPVVATVSVSAVAVVSDWGSVDVDPPTLDTGPDEDASFEPAQAAKRIPAPMSVLVSVAAAARGRFMFCILLVDDNSRLAER